MTWEMLGWLAALIVFATAEGATAQLVSVWFVGGSLAALIAAWCGGALWLQFVLFFAVSIGMLLLLRPLIRKAVKPKIVPTNADRYIGMTGVVQQDIDNLQSVGRVEVDGADWAARSETGERIEAGTPVTIVRMEGVRLFVQPVKASTLKK